MRTIEKLSQFLAQMSNGSLTLDRYGRTQFKCTNGLKCFVEQIPNTAKALCYLPLTRLPDTMASRVAMLEKALMLNLSLQHKLSASLVYDERVESLCVSAQLDIEGCHFEDFDQWLGRLIEAAPQIQEDLVRVNEVSKLQAKPQQQATTLNRAIHSAVLLKV